MTGIEHSTSRTAPALQMVLAHADRAALVELLRMRLLQEKVHVSEMGMV